MDIDDMLARLRDLKATLHNALLDLRQQIRPVDSNEDTDERMLRRVIGVILNQHRGHDETPATIMEHWFGGDMVSAARWVFCLHDAMLPVVRQLDLSDLVRTLRLAAQYPNEGIREWIECCSLDDEVIDALSDRLGVDLREVPEGWTP